MPRSWTIKTDGEAPWYLLQAEGILSGTERAQYPPSRGEHPQTAQHAPIQVEVRFLRTQRCCGTRLTLPPPITSQRFYKNA